jgi:MFS transporter, ACS family, hexuronate transporter
LPYGIFSKIHYLFRHPGNPHSMPANPISQATERSSRWYVCLFGLLFAATFLNYSQRFVFTQNTTKIQREFPVDDGDVRAADPEDAADDDHAPASSNKAYRRAASRFSLGFAFGSLFFGIMADLVSIRLLYPIVVVVWSIAGITSGMVESVVGLATSRFVLGLFEAGHWPCALRTTQRSFLPANRTAANSILQSGASIGAVATPLLVLAIHLWDPTQWRITFFVVGGLGIPWAIAWLLLVRESDVRRPVIQTDETNSGSGKEEELNEIPLWRIFLTRRWWILLFAVLCINTVWHFIRVWMVDWLENHHGYSHEFTSKFTSIYFTCTFFGALASGGLISWLTIRGWNVHRARMTTFLIMALLTAVILPVSFFSKGPFLLGGLLIVAFGSLGLFPVYYSLNQEISAKHQGKVGGSLGFSTWLTLSFFHEWVGEILEKSPEARTAIFCCVGIAPLIAYFVINFLWGKRPA